MTSREPGRSYMWVVGVAGVGRWPFGALHRYGGHEREVEAEAEAEADWTVGKRMPCVVRSLSTERGSARLWVRSHRVITQDTNDDSRA